jgi:hypothetical protein
MRLKVLLPAVLAGSITVSLCLEVAHAAGKPSRKCLQLRETVIALRAKQDAISQSIEKASKVSEELQGNQSKIDIADWDSVTRYLDRRDSAEHNVNELLLQGDEAERKYLSARDRAGLECPPHRLPSPPGIPQPSPPPPRGGVRVENLGTKPIAIALLSSKIDEDGTKNEDTVCALEKIPSGEAMVLSVFSRLPVNRIKGCEGALKLAMHNGKEIVYFTAYLGRVYQIYWDGQGWDLKENQRD